MGADNTIDNLIEKLVSQTFNARPRDHGDMDEMTLAKAAFARNHLTSVTSPDRYRLVTPSSQFLAPCINVKGRHICYAAEKKDAAVAEKSKPKMTSKGFWQLL